MSLCSEEIRVCIDIGADQHYVAIGLSNGERLEEFTLQHSPAGIKDFFNRLETLENQYALPIVVAMEGYNGHARPIDTYILDKGYKLLSVNNLKLARFKEIFPGPAKSDPIDAWKIFDMFKTADSLPVTKNALQEVVKAPEVNDKLKRLTRRRRELVNEKNRALNRMQADIRAVCPALLSVTGEAGNIWFLRFLTSRNDLKQLSKLRDSSILKIKGIGKKYLESIKQWQAEAKYAPDVEWVGPMIVEDAKRILHLMEQINNLEVEIQSLCSESQIALRLATLPGFGDITVAELAGEIGDIKRFKSESSFALYSGMAVLDNKSGKYSGTKKCKHINRRIKAALMIALAQHIRMCPESKKYYDKKRAEGKKHNQAVRAFGRHLMRVIWSMLRNDRDYICKDEVEATIANEDKVTEFAEERNTATLSLVANETREKSDRAPSEGNTATLSLVSPNIAKNDIISPSFQGAKNDENLSYLA